MNELLSPLEAVMWRIGQDPELRLVIADLILLEADIAESDIVRRLGQASEQAIRLTQWPAEPTYVRRRLHWVSGPTFDPAAHVRRLTLPTPGDRTQLLEVLAMLEAIPFEPDRPPWDATLIGGLRGGRSAIFLRAHHVLTDGLGAAPIVNLLLDARHGRTSPTGAAQSEQAPPVAPTNGHTRRVISIDLDRVIGSLGSGLAVTVEPLGTLTRGLQSGLDVASSFSRQMLVTGGPLGAWPRQRSISSQLLVMSVPGARAAALSLGGSRNDLLVAASASAIGLYLERQGEPCPALRLATPTSSRHNSEFAGNWFAPLRAEVPTSDSHPGPMFGVVAERLAQAREEPVLRLTAGLAAAAGRLPNRLLIPAMHAQAETVDFAATALPGQRGEAHLCGARVEASFPFGPRLGCPLNLTAIGNDDRLDIGVAIDRARIVDPDGFLECLGIAFSRFVPGYEPAELLTAT